MDAGTGASKGAIWDEVSEEDHHHGIKKAPYLMSN